MVYGYSITEKLFYVQNIFFGLRFKHTLSLYPSLSPFNIFYLHTHSTSLLSLINQVKRPTLEFLFLFFPAHPLNISLDTY